MQKETFSVIVPVFNSQDTIDKTLSCLIPLSEKGIKVFVSDNFSTDDTRSRLLKYEKIKNFEIKYQDRNYGFKKNYIFLLNKVNTKWVLPIGSDDYLINAEIVLKEFNSFLKNTNYVGMSFNTKFIYKNKLVSDKSNLKLVGTEFSRFKSFYINSGCNSRFYGLIRKDLFLKYFPHENFYACDVILTAKILQHGNWLYNNQIILHRERGVSADQMKLRYAYGLRGIRSLLPPFYFVKVLLNLKSSKNIIIKSLIVLLYIRYSISPIKHKLKKLLKVNK